MNDIHDIYNPIYRESNELPITILIIILTLLCLTATFLILRKLRNRKESPKTLEEVYIDVIKNITSLGDRLHESHLYYFKEFLSFVYNKNFLSMTHEELLTNNPMNSDKLETVLLNLERRVYAKDHLNPNEEKETITDIVEVITTIYNSKKEAENV